MREVVVIETLDKMKIFAFFLHIWKLGQILNSALINFGIHVW